MHITSVQAHLLSFPFPDPIRLSFHGGERTILKRDAMLIRVTTDNGLVGYAPGEGSESARDAIRDVIAPFLEGRILSDPDAARVQFFGLPKVTPHLRKIYCTVEVALYDLAAKAHGLPLSEMLGGRIRDTIRVYSSAGMYQPPEQYAEEAATMQALGFNAYKMRPGLGPDLDLEAVRQMRKVTGAGFDLMVDAHTWWRMGDNSYSAATVEQLARELADQDVAWLEEPLPPDDHEAYRRLQALELLPVATGEHEQSEEGFLDLILDGGADYIQMDVCCQGGFTLARRLFAEISRQGLRFAFHCWGTGLEVLAAAHLGICWPESVVEWLEFPVYSTTGVKSMYPFPPAAEILKQPLDVQFGVLRVPQGPGLGIEVDETVVERYPWIPGPWSLFRLESPQGTWAVTSDHSVQKIEWSEGQ